MNGDAGLDAFAGDDSCVPDQLLEDCVAYGGRLELKDASDLGTLAQDAPPWPDQLLAGDGMFGGRFELKEDPDRDALAQDDPPWPDQLLAGDGMFGGRFPPKFIPAARVPVAKALTSDLPPPHPAVLLILRPPFEPDVWPPK